MLLLLGRKSKMLLPFAVRRGRQAAVILLPDKACSMIADGLRQVAQLLTLILMMLLSGGGQNAASLCC